MNEYIEDRDTGTFFTWKSQQINFKPTIAQGETFTGGTLSGFGIQFSDYDENDKSYKKLIIGEFTNYSQLYFRGW